ncbi:glycosyltransferase family 4 protein [Patescibacteria group bacterium]|nr:glycosyltransferase family 4 protein [Patescibacteria group bacterium]
MKIGVDAHSLEGKRTGVGRVLINLLKQWDNFDLSDTKFILYFKKEIPELNLSNRFEKKLINSDSNALFIHYYLPLAAKKDKIDLLFCPSYISPIFYKGKTALILHDIIYQSHPEMYNWPSFWDRILLKEFSKISAKKTEIIFTPSKFSQKEVIKHYKINPDKVFNIPWGVDNDFKIIEDNQKLIEIKEKYKIKDKFIFYIGSIFNRRHLPEVIKAFKKISDKLSNYQFLIVGNNYANIPEQEFNHHKIIYQEYLSGKDLVKLYNAADLTIYLSDYEGFGLPPLESIACGTPVIISRKASIPEVIGEAGIYVKNNSDINEISEAIYMGLTDQNLRNDLINKGLEQVKKFSWQKSAKEILDLLLKS